MTKKTTKFGIIGGGLMGKEFASAAARWCHLSNCEVKPEIISICALHSATLEWFEQNVPGLTQTATDYHDLLNNEDIEAIYCAVPHHLHKQMYVETIQAGKHLFAEKPFGIDKAACDEVMAMIEKHPRVVVRVSSQFPFFPAVQRIIEYAKEDRFGKILEVECGFLHSSDMNVNKPINWKRTIDTNGEYGCMGDLGLHVFHVPLRLGWFPGNVRAVLSNVVPERKNRDGQLVPCETWDNATLLCEVENNGDKFPLTAKMQRIAPGETNTWYLTVKGTRFSARFTTKRPRTIETMPYEDGKAQAWHSEDLGYDSVYETITGGIFEFGFSDAILQMFASFCDQIAKGNDGKVPFSCATPQEAHWTHRIFTAALESQKNQSVVNL